MFRRFQAHIHTNSSPSRKDRLQLVLDLHLRITISPISEVMDRISSQVKELSLGFKKIAEWI